jgi:hypothetical protein
MDFSIKSFKEIDRFFEEYAPHGEARPGGLLSENFGNRMFSIGAYVGEVICRRTGARWQGDDNDPDAEINITVRFKRGQIIWPVQKVLKRFQNGPQDSIYGYGIALVNFQRPDAIPDKDSYPHAPNIYTTPATAGSGVVKRARRQPA